MPIRRVCDLDDERQQKLRLLKEQFGVPELLRLLRRAGYTPDRGDGDLAEAVDRVYLAVESAQ